MNTGHREIKGWGVDASAEQRPGVPRQHEPHNVPGAHWREPDRQRSDEPHMVRQGLEEITPVYGTAQPVRGLSGMMRRAAYGLPEHKATHWMMLLLADRVDYVEYALEKRGLKAWALPAGAAATAAGVMVLGRRRRQRRDEARHTGQRGMPLAWAGRPAHR